MQKQKVNRKKLKAGVIAVLFLLSATMISSASLIITDTGITTSDSSFILDSKGNWINLENITIGTDYTLYNENGQFRLKNKTTDLMFFNETSNEMVFTTSTRTIGFSRGSSPLKLEEGLQFYDENGVKHYSIYHAHEDEAWINVPDIFNDSIIFELEEEGNPYGMEWVLWDKTDQRPHLVINHGGSGRASIFDRSLMIGKELGIATLDADYTRAEGFNLIDCDTGLTGADLGVEDDIEAKGSILAQENIIGSGLIVDGESTFNGLVTFNDNITILKYNVDYSSNFTDRNLVDKEYADYESILAKTVQSTGILYGGILSKPTYTTLDWTAGEGQIVDYSNPANPEVTRVSWEEVTSYSPINLGTVGQYMIVYNKSGDVSEISVENLNAQVVREYIIIGVYTTFSGIIVRLSPSSVNVGYNGFNSFKDFARDVIGPANINGNIISATGGNLSIDNSGGLFYIVGSNFRNDPTITDEKSVANESAIYYTRVLREASPSTGITQDGSGMVNVIDPTKYDDGSGTLATISGNRYSVQVVYITADGGYVVAYGQELFNTESLAEEAVTSGTILYEEYPLLQRLVRRAYIVVQSSETDLSNALFIADGKFRVGGVTTGTGVKIHSSLTGLEWNVAGHLFEDGGIIDIENYNFTTNGSIYGTLMNETDPIFTAWDNSFTQGSIIFSNGSGLTEDSNSRLFWNDANDRLGVGTNSPRTTLHIKANTPGTVGSHPAGQLIIQDPDDSTIGNVAITGYESDGAGNPDQQLWYLGSASSSNSDIIFLNRRNANLKLGTSSITRMTIDASGNVGIGTANPDAKLEVTGDVWVFKSAGNPRILVGDSASSGQWGGLDWDSTSDYLQIMNSGYSGSNGAINILSSGNVGIGTATPQNKLNVIGDGNFTGTVYGNAFVGNGSGLTGVANYEFGSNNFNGSGTYNGLSIIPESEWIYLSGDGSIEEGLDISIPKYPGRDFYYGYGGGENHYFGHSSNLIIHSNGNLITTGTGTFGDLIVNGYTKLGSDAPAIKMKKLTGTTASTEGGYTNIAHGLTASKIISITGLVDAGSNLLIPPAFEINSEYEYNIWISGNDVWLQLHSTNSGNLLSKSYTILVTYEE